VVVVGVKISLEVSKVLAELVGGDVRDVLLRALVEKALINQLLFKEKVSPRLGVDEEFLDFVMELDKKIKKALAKKYYQV